MSTHPMTKSELIEKHWLEIAGQSWPVTAESIRDILTRLLEAYDAQRGVEGWQREAAGECADHAIGKCRVMYGNREQLVNELAALIASHAPKGVDVESFAPILWARFDEMSLGKIDLPNKEGRMVRLYAVSFENLQKCLAAALLAAQGEK